MNIFINPQKRIKKIQNNIYNIVHLQFFNIKWELQNYTNTSDHIAKAMSERSGKLEKFVNYYNILFSKFSHVRIDFILNNNYINILVKIFSPCIAMISDEEKIITKNKRKGLYK